MTPLEIFFFWASAYAYALASSFYLAALAFGRQRLLRVAWVLTVVGFGCHTASLIARGAATGHIPAMGDYENTVAGAWFIVLATLLLGWRHRRLGAIGVVTVPLSLLFMGYGFLQGPALKPLSPPLQTLWLYVHVFFAWLAYSAFTVAFGAAVLYLLKERARPGGDSLRWLPELEVLDDIQFQWVVFGFIAATVMIASGSIWASRLWGSYWSWDPVEIWSLISWLIYGILIHLRRFYGWRGRRAAWLVVGALPTVLIAFWGVGFFSAGLHLFRQM